MAKNIELLLVSLWRTLAWSARLSVFVLRYARNYLPGMAEFPTEARVLNCSRLKVEPPQGDALAKGKRHLGQTRWHHADLASPNERQRHFVRPGFQRDISDALIQGGFNVGISAVRLSVAIRTSEYDVPIQFGKDFAENITVVVESESVIEEMAMTHLKRVAKLSDRRGRIGPRGNRATSGDPKVNRALAAQPGRTASFFILGCGRAIAECPSRRRATHLRGSDALAW